MTPKASIHQPPSSVAEIIAQVRFPALLTISAATPAAFQERVRAQFPHFGLSQDRQAYVFQGERQPWVLTLTSDSLALQVRGDAAWDGFKTAFATAIQALSEVYRPTHLARIGLRIRHVLRRSAYGLGVQDWNRLLHPHLASTCVWPELGGEVQMSRGEIVVALKGKPDQLRIGHGLIVIQSPQGEQREVGYLLDQDVFVERRVSTGEALKKLDEFYGESQRTFRQCLTDRLLRAMAPSAVVEKQAA